MTGASSPGARSTANVMRGFNPYLHGARGLFAFMIVIFHVVNSRLPTFPVLSQSWPLFLLRSLEHGVELFFGISGIVIVGALSRARGPLLFATERATRIYPVLWASVLAIAGLSALTHFEGRGLPTAPVLIENLLALPPVFPGPLIHPAAWSLSYELLFYGCCALAWALRRRIGAWSALLVVPVAAVLLTIHFRAILMVMGMLVAFGLARHPAWSKYARAPGLWLIVFLVAWEAVCEQNGGDLNSMNALALSPWTLPFAVVAVAAATISLGGILGGEGVFCAWLGSAPLQVLGSMSYSLYLWHPIVMSIVKHFMYVAHVPERVGPYSQALFFCIILAPSLALAWVSQQILEKRLTVWLRRRLERGSNPRSIHPPQTPVHSYVDSPRP